MDWVRSVTDHALTNKRNGSVIRAYACTANVGSGGWAPVFFSHVVNGRPVAVEPSKYGKLPKDYLDPVWWGDLKRRLEDRGFDLSKGYGSPWYDNRLTASRRMW